MNESCHIWVKHVKHAWVMSNVNESCHTWTSHVTYERVMPHMNKTCHVWISHVTYKWSMSHIHRKRNLYLPLGSVNLELKVMGTPDQISSPLSWNRVSPGCPGNFNTELTEPTRQIKTTFPMSMNEAYHKVMSHMNESCHVYTEISQDFDDALGAWDAWRHNGRASR